MQKKGCKLPDPPANSLIIDMDEAGAPVSQRAQRCDYLLFAILVVKKHGALLFCPVEMKQTISTKAIKQLQAGTIIGEKLLADCQEPIEFLPTCVYRQSAHSDILRDFRTRKVAFRHCGKKINRYVQEIKSGNSLSQVLAKELA